MTDIINGQLIFYEEIREKLGFIMQLIRLAKRQVIVAYGNGGQIRIGPKKSRVRLVFWWFGSVFFIRYQTEYFGLIFGLKFQIQKPNRKIFKK